MSFPDPASCRCCPHPHRESLLPADSEWLAKEWSWVGTRGAGPLRFCLNECLGIPQGVHQVHHPDSARDLVDLHEDSAQWSWSPGGLGCSDWALKVSHTWAAFRPN